jgi:hypothetical protein
VGKTCSTHGKLQNDTNFAGKLEEKILLRRRTRHLGDIIKVNIAEIGCDCVYSIHVAQDMGH